MNILEAKKQVKSAVAMYLSKNEVGAFRIPLVRQRPLFLLGSPGIGKTAIMEQIAQELGIGLVSYSMTHHTRQSALGLPFIVSREFEGFHYEASEYTMSEIVASIYDYMLQTGTRQGILFLDEINCVSETLYPSMLQFLQFKTFGRHRIPEGWVVVCAGNPKEFNKSAHDFDIVTLDRMRKIVVEADYPAWRLYAAAKNIHPAILSFLDIKKECFYLVESTVAEKSFVTARGWEDLSGTMRLLEQAGEPIDRCLIEQFLQNDEIAERFAVYYELFNKYRTDYQVPSILDGTYDDALVERAQAAPFDERLALMGLMLDALTNLCDQIDLRDTTLTDVRDTLRSLREPMESGQTMADTLGALIDKTEVSLKEQAAQGTLSENDLIRQRSLLKALKDMASLCEKKTALAGKPAFDLCHYEYRGLVAKLEQSVKECHAAIDSGYAFLDKAFGMDREELVFTTELTSRTTTLKFLNKFDSESYFKHNEGLLYEGHRVSLQSRIKDLRELQQDKVEADAYQEVLDFRNELHEYYSALPVEYGFNSLCKVTLPDNISGKALLDIGCRRGKGVFKMSSKVGEKGSVLGIEWNESMLMEARNRMDRAWRDSGLMANNMSFELAYPEDLSMAGASDDEFDYVFMNSIFNLTYNHERVLHEAYRVLKPGGTLIFEGVFANAPRDPHVVSQARALGNTIQAAPFQQELERMLKSAGFQEIRYFERKEVDPAMGAVASHEIPVVESDEVLTYTAAVLHVIK